MAKTAAAQAKWNEATELYGRIQGILELGDVSQEKQNELDTLFGAFDAAEAEAKRLDAIAERAANIGERVREADQAVGRLGAGAKPGPDALSGERGAARKAYQKLLKVGDKHLSDMERKALRADVASEGGFFLAPQEVTAEYVKFVDDLVFIRQLATVYQLDMAESLGIPTIESDIADADWTSELLTGNEDAGLKTGKRELKPVPLAKRIRVSRKLLRQSRFDPESLVRERMGYKFAVSMEKAFLTGSGANQPLGVFTPSVDGISTARNITAAGAAAIVADDLINTKHHLKAAYWGRPNTRWIFGRPVISAIRKLKDTTNNYIWAPGLGPGGGLTGGLPATILDVPYVVSEYAPSTITSGLYTAIIGDFSFYWIAEVQQLEIQVLMELYAATNQVGYIGRMELDGMPVIEEAFARLIQA
jgi:HK97 family phage major capsid protein